MQTARIRGSTRCAISRTLLAAANSRSDVKRLPDLDLADQVAAHTVICIAMIETSRGEILETSTKSSTNLPQISPD